MVKGGHSKDPQEAKRWLIVGAHKAGASEKKMVKLSGLSKPVIRQILLNFKKTGKPSLPPKQRSIKNKLIVEYDENGDMIDDSDDDENDLKAIKTTKDLIQYTKLKINKTRQDASKQVKLKM
jgi:transposase